MLRYYEKRSQGEEFTEVKAPRSGDTWVYGEEITTDDIEYVTSSYNLNRNIVNDVLDAAELPRIEYDNDTEYVFLRMPSLTKKGSLVTSPFLLIIQNKQFISLARASSSLPVDKIASSMRDKQARPASLLLASTAALVASYEDLIQHTSNSIHDTGNRLRTHEVTNNDFIHFVTVEQNLNEYQMNLDSMVVVTQRLQENKHEIFNDDELEAIADITLHLKQLLVGVETSAKRVDSIRNAYSTIANNNLNQRMRILTVFTVLIALPNVFYGMYGMNVVLPFHDQPWAYGAIVSFTVILLVVVYTLAKRTKLF